jgi:hypothetical protein
MVDISCESAFTASIVDPVKPDYSPATATFAWPTPDHLPDEKATAAIGFMVRAQAFFAAGPRKRLRTGLANVTSGNNLTHRYPSVEIITRNRGNLSGSAYDKEGRTKRPAEGTVRKAALE